MKKIIATTLSAAMLLGAFAFGGMTAKAEATAAPVSGSISISGSSALYPLVNAAADPFKAANPDVSMTVAAGGSGTGLNNVLASTVDIGNSDVFAADKLAPEDAAKLVDHQVCIIGVSVIVNSDVGATVTNLTKDQLKGIFGGTITNWKDVGGPDEAITIVNRPSSSGTRALFTKWALDSQADVEGDTSLQTDDSNALLTTIASTKGTIGYLALSYLVNATDGVSKVQIDGVDATYDNIYSNQYPVWGYEHMYTNGQPNAQTQAFIDFMGSDTVSALVESMGYGVTAKLSAEAVQAKMTPVSGTIAASGSSALFPLVSAAADQFKTFNPDASMNIAAGGSGTGLNNVLAGTVDIGNSDVYASEKLGADDAAKLVDHKVCIIGVSVIVNADVGATVTNLTKDQLKGIFGGTITNWKDVGGPDEAITIVNRPSSSGTRALFTKWALDGQADVEGDTSLQTDDSNALLTTIAGTKGTIGYLALSYLVNANADIAKVQIDGVDATYDNIYANKYQVWGYEHMYTLGQPNVQTQAFLDYMTSPAVAAMVDTMGYGETAKLNADAASSR